MASIDPATGKPLPADAIQRILFICNSVHVYNIPPLASTRGHIAASWTEDPKRHLATCRVRIIETALSRAQDEGGNKGENKGETKGEGEGESEVKTDVVLEEMSSGQLFAAAPYTATAVVEPASDSSRFFALRVQDPTGRKATLGMGFEERSDAFDFGVALQEAQRALGLGAPDAAPRQRQEKKVEPKRDYSLKEGETITVKFGGSKFGNRPRPGPAVPERENKEPANLAAFALPPPPSAASSSSSSSSSLRSSLGAPPSYKSAVQKTMAQDLGFDDGQNGEFA